MSAIIRYFRSTSARSALFVGAVMYACYGIANDDFANSGLIGVCAFVAVFLPFYSRLSNKAEEVVNRATALVTAGRLTRFAVQLPFNLAIFWVFVRSGLLHPANLEGLGGMAGVAVLTTLASQGAQYLAIICYNRNVGDLNRNVLAGLAVNIVVTALASAGVAWLKTPFVTASLALGATVFLVGVASDLRGLTAPRGGVGVFFGTFNPFHRTHLAMVRDALERRGLDKVVIHPTIVPKLHARALRRGEIRVARVEDGLAVYEKTELADPNVNYFPTGNRFYPPETRRLMIELTLAEAGLADRVEVAYHPEVYAERGFHGVLAEIRRRHPGQRLHGLHGSDLGGMWVRAIYDECGWIYPLAVRRRDGVSATAIRNGAAGMTTRAIDHVLAQLRADADILEIDGRRYRNDHGLLHAA